MKKKPKSYSSSIQDTNQIWCRSTKFFQNQDPIQEDFTSDFNTRTTFYTLKTPAKFCFDSLTPSKVIMHPAGTRTNRQTDIHFFLFFSEF